MVIDDDRAKPGQMTRLGPPLFKLLLHFGYRRGDVHDEQEWQLALCASQVGMLQEN